MHDKIWKPEFQANYPNCSERCLLSVVHYLHVFCVVLYLLEIQEMEVDISIVLCIRTLVRTFVMLFISSLR